jgi:hypothetical protein
MWRLTRILFPLWAPYSGPRRARRACEGAERGDGVPASDRAGVRGRAPVYLVSHLLVVFGAFPAAAQTRVSSLDELQRQLTRGDSVFVVTESGTSIAGRLERLGAVDVDIRVGNKVPARRVGNARIVTIPVNDIRSLERQRDSVRNGAAIGAGVGAGFVGTVFVYAFAVDRNEMDEWAPLYAKYAVVYTGLGALVGWAIDAAHSKPRLMFEQSGTTPRIALRPLLSRDRGIAVAISF